MKLFVGMGLLTAGYFEINLDDTKAALIINILTLNLTPDIKN